MCDLDPYNIYWLCLTVVDHYPLSLASIKHMVRIDYKNSVCHVSPWVAHIPTVTRVKWLREMCQQSTITGGYMHFLGPGLMAIFFCKWMMLFNHKQRGWYTISPSHVWCLSFNRSPQRCEKLPWSSNNMFNTLFFHIWCLALQHVAPSSQRSQRAPGSQRWRCHGAIASIELHFARVPAGPKDSMRMEPHPSPEPLNVQRESCL